MTAAPRVFTIPSSTPFLPALARALLDGVLIPGFAPKNDPLALARATVYLPTRRATRAFGEALLDALGAEATLLPRIVPLGDADEDALAFAESTGAPERPSPISATERRIVLAKLVLAFARSDAASLAASPAAALQLADELARLFDDLTIAGISFDAIAAADFVPAGLDVHWQRSLEFLQIARQGWDAHLAEHEQADPTVWRDSLLAREAARLAAGGGPVIAAGSTGTIPAVARLIATIARRADGAVVLPGLDQWLDEPSYRLIEHAGETEPSPGHPQFGLKRLIERIGIERQDARPLGEANAGREVFLSEAFRPAATTERWRERGEDRDALAGVAVIEAADPREEALALAVAMRESLETPGAEAALITPDRALARRVAAELRRWEIAVDDSGGVALQDSDAGRFARLVASVVAQDFAPVPLLALLRHPMNTLGTLRAIDALEIAVLRGPRPAAGAQGLLGALKDARAAAEGGDLHRRDARMRLRERDWELATVLADKLASSLDPLCRLAGSGPAALGQLLAAHRAALENLGFDFTRHEPVDARALAEAFERFAQAASHAAPLSLADYADAFVQLLAGEAPVRPPFDRMARLRILGPLEARLLACDLVLLGGLNEGTWPPETHADAWLNRPMRNKLKLDLPERRIGLSAHDFVQAVSAGQVVVSRARKQDGVETVASRFLHRLAAVAPDDAWRAACERGRRHLDLAHALERAERVGSALRPAAKPPADARPARLSVTEIETLIRDPYSIYARHVLRLLPLEEIDADPGAAERGTVLHDAFARFARDFPDAMPPDALRELLVRGEAAFAVLNDYPGLRAIWWPRFKRAAEWFVGLEAELRPDIAHTLAELSGRIEFDAGGRTFTLTARADRVDLRRDGSVAIFDYKTGQPPGLKETFIGLTPQLALEAAIAKAGGFEGVPKEANIGDIVVVRLSGGHPPGAVRSFKPEDAPGPVKSIVQKLQLASCDDLADAARAGLERLIASYADPAAPYRSIPRPKWRGRFGEYDHLARIREWSANELDDEFAR